MPTGTLFSDYILGLSQSGTKDNDDKLPIIQGGNVLLASMRELLQSPSITLTDSDDSEYTLTIDDSYKTIFVDRTTSIDVIIPSGVFFNNELISIIRVNTGEVNFVESSVDVTIIPSLGTPTDAGIIQPNVLDFFTDDIVLISNGAPQPTLTSASVITALGFTPADIENTWTRVDLIAADRVFSSTSFADITGLSFPVLSGTRVEFRAVLYVDTGDVTEGFSIGINGPALTAMRYVMRNMNTDTSEGQRIVTSYDSLGNSSGTPFGDVYFIFGRILTAANGTVILRLRCETASFSVTVLRGSYIEWRYAAF